MKSGLSLIFILLLIAAAGCELEVKNLKVPDFQQKLVVSSFISPYDTISLVSIYSNEKVFGELNDSESLGNLTATVSNGQKEIILRNINGRYYFKPNEMTIEEGKTYVLRVSSDKGLTAEASCTVPIKKELHPEADTVKELSKYEWMPDVYFINTNYYITDPSGEANFYRFYSNEIEYYPGNLSVWQVGSVNAELLNDTGKDGQRIFAYTASVTEPSPDCDSAKMILYILQTDKQYYNYHHSLENYSGGEVPFSEISPVYSNIEGGLGIFASYVVDSLVTRLK
jgi:hypothetical protein